jgi:hypothetical protein
VAATQTAGNKLIGCFAFGELIKAHSHRHRVGPTFVITPGPNQAIIPTAPSGRLADESWPVGV